MTPDRVIAGRNYAPEAIVDALGGISSNALALDIGAGGGRLLNSLNQVRPDVRVAELDYDWQLCFGLTSDRPHSLVANGDAFFLPFPGNTFDSVVAINVFHEVCSGKTNPERLLKFYRALAEVRRILKPGGRVLIFDGSMPPVENCQVVVIPKDQESTERLGKFKRTYKAARIGFRQTGDEFIGSLRDVILFQTKSGYVGTPVWTGESQQFYTFVKETDMARALSQLHFNINTLRHLEPRIGVQKFLQQYDVFTILGGSRIRLDTNNFPQTQILVDASKMFGLI